MQDNKIFLNVAMHYFGSHHDLLLFPEVRISTHYWVAQEPAYQRLLESYGLYNLTCNATDATVFMIYDLVRQKSRYVLQQARVESSTIDSLFKAFQHNLPVPSKDTFVRRLNEKIEGETQSFRLQLEVD